MFGYVMANVPELTEDQRHRYEQVYCGICRQIRQCAGQSARLGLRYDMAFLALLLMSLYEPEEQTGTRACSLHPVRPRQWTENPFIRYGAAMNVALAYYNAADDAEDDGSFSARIKAGLFGKNLEEISNSYPRQCQAMKTCMEKLHRLEAENCPNPDLPAGCFGELMAELLVAQEDLWAPTLRQMGMALGRYIYLADAAVDFRKDRKNGNYNPFLAMGMGEDWDTWEQYLVLAMGRCTAYYEQLPLVQDKALLDNILYSGIWLQYRRRQKRSKEVHDR